MSKPNYFVVSMGPSMSDPMDQAPLLLGQYQIAAVPWWSRLGIWLLRRYMAPLIVRMPNVA